MHAPTEHPRLRKAKASFGVDVKPSKTYAIIPLAAVTSATRLTKASPPLQLSLAMTTEGLVTLALRQSTSPCVAF